MLAGCLHASALEFEKVHATTTENSVRIKGVPRAGADLAGVELQGVLKKVSNGQLLWHGPLSSDKTISGLKPQLWSPASPILCHYSTKPPEMIHEHWTRQQQHQSKRRGTT